MEWLHYDVPDEFVVAGNVSGGLRGGGWRAAGFGKAHRGAGKL